MSYVLEISKSPSPQDLVTAATHIVNGGVVDYGDKHTIIPRNTIIGFEVFSNMRGHRVGAYAVLAVNEELLVKSDCKAGIKAEFSGNNEFSPEKDSNLVDLLHQVVFSFYKEKSDDERYVAAKNTEFEVEEPEPELENIKKEVRKLKKH